MSKKIIRTVSALLHFEDKVLLHKHPKLGMFMGPGGKVEEDEYETQALVREIKEETGLDIQLHSTLLDYQRSLVKSPDYTVIIELDCDDAIMVDHTYFINVNKGIINKEIKTENENIEFCWYTMSWAINNLPMFNDTKHQVEKLYVDYCSKRNYIKW